MNDTLLYIDNLSIGYHQPICSGIQASVHKGELVGLAGRNGSGKSTLIKTLLGLQPKLGGSIHYQSEDIQKWTIQEKAQKIAVVFSRLNQVPPISVYDLVSLGRLPYQTGFSKLNDSDKNLIEESFELVEISHLKSKFANQLSDGQLQMVMIARALVQQTDLVMMDEPTSHLDIENQFKIFELIYKLASQTGKTFIVASHQLDLLLQNASQLWWMDKGNFHAGFPEQIAFEQSINEKLSQEFIQFNYEAGKFQFKIPNHKEVEFHSDASPLAFWVKHALERKGFVLKNNSELKIEIKENQIQLNNHNFESIQQLLEHLK
jgi:iron complex transport system ATP-binding protein